MRTKVRITACSIVVLVWIGALAAVASAPVLNGQELTINRTEVTVGELISVVENQTDYTFAYRRADIDINRRVDLSGAPSNVGGLLNAAFSAPEYNIVTKGRHIIIKRKPVAEPPAEPEPPLEAGHRRVALDDFRDPDVVRVKDGKIVDTQKIVLPVSGEEKPENEPADSGQDSHSDGELPNDRRTVKTQYIPFREDLLEKDVYNNTHRAPRKEGREKETGRQKKKKIGITVRQEMPV